MVVVKERIPLRRLVQGNIVRLGQLTNILVASDAYIIGVQRLTIVLEPIRIVVDQHNVLPAISVHSNIPGR